MAGHKALGAELRRIREEKGLHLAQVAEPVGIGVSMLSQIESGAKGTSIANLRALARQLDVDFMRLVDLIEQDAS